MTQLPPPLQTTFPETEACSPTVPAPPKWSISAILGFILSFLLVLAPIGALLGVVGIVRTWGGRRRGMALAVAAIPIGLIVSALVAAVGLTLVVMRNNVRYARETASLLQASSVRVPEVAAEFYEQQNSLFQRAVSSEEFERWLADVVKSHGSLLQLKRSERPFSVDAQTGEWTVNLVGEFANGTAHVGVVVANPDGIHAELRNISVEGVSAVPSPALDTPEGIP